MRCRAVPPPCHFSGGGCLGGGISVSVISAGLGGVGDLGRPRHVSAVSAVSVVSAGLCGLGGLEGLVGGVTTANFRRRVRAGGHRTCHEKHRKNSRKGGQNLQKPSQKGAKTSSKPPPGGPRRALGPIWAPSVKKVQKKTPQARNSHPFLEVFFALFPPKSSKVLPKCPPERYFVQLPKTSQTVMILGKV